VSLLNLYQFGVLSVILAWTTSGFAGSLEDAVAAWRQRDVAKTFELLRPLAEQGVAQAQWRLGMIYLTEQKNDAEAVKWFRKAADQDDDQGQWFLGNMYFSGWGVRKDEVEAASWYRKAADKGHIDARESWVLFTSPDREWCRITLRQRSGCERRPTKATVPPRRASG
jgi:TPR repeat protein